jgi:predicted MFS family arabinose efflux permease
VNFVYAAIVLKEPARREPTAADTGVRLQALRNPTIRNLCVTYFLYSFAVAQLETIFAYFMKDSFGYDAREVAGVLVLMALVMMTIQGGAIRPLVARFGERALLFAGVALMAAAFVAIPWPGAVSILLIPLVVASVGRAISQPSMMGLVSFEGSQQNKGAVMGAFHSSASAARVLGPLAAGALYDYAHAAPFFLAGALSVGALAVSSRLPGGAADQRR